MVNFEEPRGRYGREGRTSRDESRYSDYNEPRGRYGREEEEEENDRDYVRDEGFENEYEDYNDEDYGRGEEEDYDEYETGRGQSSREGSRRGFTAMDEGEQRRISSRGGRASHGGNRGGDS